MPTTPTDLHPLFADPDALAIVNDLLASQSDQEWNACLARIVTFLFIASTPKHSEVDQAREDHLTYKMLQLSAIIERGRQTTPNRHAYNMQARIDARNLDLRAAAPMGMEQALMVFEVLAGPQLLTDEARRLQRDTFRDRLERAEKAGGFRVTRRARRKLVPTQEWNDLGIDTDTDMERSR